MQLSERYKSIYQQTHADHVFCPYRVCPLGAHVDHQYGLVTGFAIDRGVELLYSPTSDGSIVVHSENYADIAYFNVFDEILERGFVWGDFVKGAVMALKRKYQLKRGFCGLIKGSLPVGGLSSSAAVILSYLQAICKINDIHLTQGDLINHAIWVERNYIGVNIGKLDQSCEVYCKKGYLMFLDTKDDSVQLVPQNPQMQDFEICIIFSGVERKLAGSAYNMRVDECKAAAYALKAYAGMEYGKFETAYLRDVPRGIFEEHAEVLPRNWYKRALHFYDENARVKQGILSWQQGDIEAFGRLIFESGSSSINLYETGSEELKALYDILTSCPGVYGGRFSGAGFNGCTMAIVNPNAKDEITHHVTEHYTSHFPNLKDSFSVHFCKTADGINLF